MARIRASRRRLLATLGSVLAAVLVAGYGAASYFVYEGITKVDRPWCPAYASFAGSTPSAFSTGSTDTGPLLDTAPYLMPDYQAVSFPSRDPGVTIAGWWVPAADPAAPAVVVVHGYGRCKGDPEVLLPAGMLHRHGFAVLMIDLRNHGDSTVTDGRTTIGVLEHRDVLGAWDWLKTIQGVPADRLGLFGVSFGAGTSLIAMGQEPDVAAAWADSAFADVDLAIAEELARRGLPDVLTFGGLVVGRVLHGVDLTSRSPREAMSRLAGRPLAIVHGAADTWVSPKHAELLVAAAWASGSVVEPWYVRNAGHVRSAFVATADYERRLVAFFSAAIGAPGAE